MSAVVKVGENEVIFSGNYSIPINTPHINIYLPEQDFTFKIAFEEGSPENEGDKKKPRIEINKANGDIADVKFFYYPGEVNFKSTRHPNNLFFSVNKERNVKIQYHYNLDFNVDRKNSIALRIQITKSPELVHEEREGGDSNGN